MKKVIKWILGIVVVLLVLAVIAGVGYLAINRWGSAHWMMSARSFQPRDGERVRPWRDVPQFEMPMHPKGKMPMGPNGWFPRQRFGGFFPLGMIFGGLFWVGVIALSIVGAISLLRGRNGTQKAVVSALPVAPVTAQAPSPAPVRTCANCAHTVQEDWGHCPYCGNKLE